MGEMFETYAGLLEELKKLTPEQLAQPVQVFKGTNDDSLPVTCQPVFAIHTVEAGFETDSETGTRSSDHQYVRDVRDGKHHSEAVVLQMDVSSYDYDRDGRKLSYALKALRRIADKETPIKDGNNKIIEPSELARVTIEKIEAVDEKEKEKILKECV